MSLFIAALAYGGTPTEGLAKIGILGASVIAGIGGMAILRSGPAGDPSLTLDEGEVGVTASPGGSSGEP